jgi:hypothetical protein
MTNHQRETASIRRMIVANGLDAVILQQIHPQTDEHTQHSERSQNDAGEIFVDKLNDFRSCWS